MKYRYSLMPKIITVIKEGYSKSVFLKDLNAGVIVGIVAIPLAIAFAIASGVKPEQGLYTAIIAGFLISLLGGSRFQIGGPTGAFVVVVYSIMAKFGYEGLATATILAGFMLILMAVMKVGTYIKFIPYPVTVGFTSGIALIIFTSQLRDFFGLSMAELPPDFVHKVSAYAGSIGTINPAALGLGAASLLVLRLWPKRIKKIPASLVVILLGTAAAHFMGLKVETIQSRFGEMPHTLPSITLPRFNMELIRQVFPAAITIALLAGIESLLSAVVADGMTGRRHRSNAEIMAQGFANIGSILFGGIPATGAIARTATNIKNGGISPVAGLIHALTVLLIMLLFGKWAGMIPLCVLAAILISVSYHMSEWRTIAGIFKYPKSDVAVMAATFFLTIFVDLTVAIQVGVLLAMFLLMHRISEVTHAGYITNSLHEEEDTGFAEAVSKAEVPEGVEVFQIDGVFFFGAVDLFKDAVDGLKRKPKVFILQMSKVLSIDGAGIKALEEIQERMENEKTALVLSGVHAQPLHALEKDGFIGKIGKGNVVGNIDMALNRARKILQNIQ